MEKFSLHTGGQTQLIDITAQIQKIVSASAMRAGVCPPHNRCGYNQ